MFGRQLHKEGSDGYWLRATLACCGPHQPDLGRAGRGAVVRLGLIGKAEAAGEGEGPWVRQPRRNEWRCPFTRLTSAGMLLTTAFAALLLPSFGATAKLSLNGNPFLFVPRATTAAVLGSIELSSPDASSSLPMQCDNAGEDHDRALCTSPQDAGLVTSICSD